MSATTRQSQLPWLEVSHTAKGSFDQCRHASLSGHMTFCQRGHEGHAFYLDDREWPPSLFQGSETHTEIFLS